MALFLLCPFWFCFLRLMVGVSCSGCEEEDEMMWRDGRCLLGKLVQDGTKVGFAQVEDRGKFAIVFLCLLPLFFVFGFVSPWNSTSPLPFLVCL